MNARTNSIEMVPAMIESGRNHSLNEPFPRVALTCAMRFGAAVYSGEPGRSLVLRWADDRAGEFWETLSYAVIWLSGLIGIGLCFL
jgi:hypothetical protein